MRGLTILALADHGPAAAVEERLLEWARAGLLDDVMVCRLSPDGPASRVLTAQGALPVDLFEVVASEPYEVIRLVAARFHPLRGDDGVGRGAQELGADLLKLIAAPHQQLMRVNLLLPVSGGQGADPSVMDGTWDLQVLVSPEDRRSDRHADRRVLQGANEADHATLALTVVGGLWRGMDGSPFDGRTVVQNGDRQLVVVRNLARVLQADGLVPDVIGALAERVNDPGWLAETAGAVVVRDPDGLVASVGERFLHQHADVFTYHSANPPVTPRLRQVGYVAACGSLLRRLFGGRVELVRGAFDESADRFSAQARPGAPIGGKVHELSMATTTTSALPPEASRLTADLAVLVRNQLKMPDAQVPTPPRLWTDLRQTALGLVDGGDIPLEGFVRREGIRREVIGDGDRLVPPPPPFVAKVGNLRPEVRAGDVHQARLLERALEADLATARSRGDVDTAGGIQAELKRLREWITRCSPTLAWRVATRVADEYGRASNDLVAGVREVASRKPAEAGSGEASKSGATAGYVILGVLAALGLAGAVDRALRTTWQEGAVLAGGVLLVWFLVAALVHKGRRNHLLRLEHAEASRRVAERATLQRISAAANEVVRLESLYDQLRDWIDIVAHVVHDAPVSVPSPEPPPVVPHSAANAVRFGRTGLSTEGRRRLAGLVGRTAFRQGWLLELYAEMEQRSLRKLRTDVGREDDSTIVAPDSDLGAHARQTVLADLRGGLWRSAREATLAGHALEVLATTSPDGLFGAVEDLSDAASAPVLNADEFLVEALPQAERPGFNPALWSVLARVDRQSDVAASVVLAPTGLARRVEGAPGVVVHPLDVVTGNDFRAYALRFDHSDIVTVHDLDCFAAAPHRPPPTVLQDSFGGALE